MGGLLKLEASTHQGLDQHMPMFNLPSEILCKVVHVQLRAEPETDEVYAQITLLPEQDIGRVFNPIGYGVDPTGEKDSTDAILSVVIDAYGVKRELIMMPGISDLGGVVIDLQGGDYKISKPIAFPSQG